jgi:hypothetical protein
VSISWSGIDAFQKALNKVIARADLASREIVASGAALVERQAKSNFQGSHKPGQPHVGGDQPNIVSGDLRRSVGAEPITRSGPGEYATKVGPRMVYGRAVQLGYRTQRAFPYFPSQEQVKAQLAELSARTWSRFINS